MLPLTELPFTVKLVIDVVAKVEVPFTESVPLNEGLLVIVMLGANPPLDAKFPLAVTWLTKVEEAYSKLT